MDTTEEPVEQVDPADDPMRLNLDQRAIGVARRAVVTAVLVSAVVLGLLAWSPWTDDLTAAELDTIQARDDAREAATEALVTFNTVDPSKSRETVDEWLRLSNGALHRDLGRRPAQIAAGMRRKGTSTTATVLETAVSTLDPSAGRATVLGVIEVRTTPRGGKPTVAVRRLRVLMQHIDSKWRITYLETVRST